MPKGVFSEIYVQMYACMAEKLPKQKIPGTGKDLEKSEY
jgi:hypothetical protein